MPVTTPYGYLKPVDGERGATWFDNLEFNITRVDAHNHDGVDSALLTPTSLTKTTATALAASWALVANGIYKQTITVPAGFTVDDYFIFFRNNSTGAPLELEFDKMSSTTFDLFINDNTVEVKIIYG